MYIMIFEDGSVWTQKNFSPEDKQLVIDGSIIALRVADHPAPQEFYSGEWVDVEAEAEETK